MPETPLEYDKIIWEVFAIGITASVVILYYVIKNESEIPSESFKLLALILGFSILLYSTFLVLGYGTKKGLLINFLRRKSLVDESKLLLYNLAVKLDKTCYPRVKRMAELILVGIISVYFYAFYYTTRQLFSLLIPTLVLVIFIILCTIANICAKKKISCNIYNS